MIIGNGQIAKQFRTQYLENHFLIFASGVSNSACVDACEFDREKELIIQTTKSFPDHTFVYFSSCYLSAKKNVIAQYYAHKIEMEKLIQNQAKKHLILRVPQLFSYPRKHSTLIHFLYFSIIEGKEFRLNTSAYRYLLDAADLPSILKNLAHVNSGIFDIANPYRYSVKEIISILESITCKDAIYTEYAQHDTYEIDFKFFELLSEENRKILSGKSYFFKRMTRYHIEFQTQSN